MTSNAADDMSRVLQSTLTAYKLDTDYDSPFVNRYIVAIITSPSARVRSIVMSMSVCLTGVQKIKTGHVTRSPGSYPFQGWFVIHRLRLAMINLPTKFEISISAYYEGMKGDENI